MWFPREMMACHADVVRLYVLPKGHMRMPRPTWSDRVCCPRVIITCHTQHLMIVYAFQWRWWYATPDAVWPYVLPKDDDGMPSLKKSYLLCCPRLIRACHTRRHPTMYAVQGQDGMQCPTLSNRVCYLSTIMTWNTWRRPTVCAVHRRWWHDMTDVLYHMCCPWAIMARNHISWTTYTGSYNVRHGMSSSPVDSVHS